MATKKKAAKAGATRNPPVRRKQAKTLYIHNRELEPIDAFIAEVQEQSDWYQFSRSELTTVLYQLILDALPYIDKSAITDRITERAQLLGAIKKIKA